MFLSLGILAGVFHFGLKNLALRPTRLQVVSESLVEFISSLVKENIGAEGLKFFPLILSLFLFILLGNILGMIPGSFTFTSHIAVTLVFGILVFIVMTGIGFARHGIGFLNKFVPSGVPWIILPIIVLVEIISFCFRPISLGVRLFANMLAGHVVLKIFAGFSVMLGAAGIFLTLTNVIFTGFEIFVACLQAYIFTVLSCSYLSDVLNIDH